MLTIFLEKALAGFLGLLCLGSAVILVIVVANLLYRWSSDASLPKTLPWVGVKPDGGRLGRLRATLASLFNMKVMMDEGYNKYSKHDQVYVLPHILAGPEVVLPVSQARWLAEQPTTQLCQLAVNRQFLEADYTMLHPNIVREPVHPEVIKRELTHRLNSFSEDLVDEMQACLEENWGVDTENWKEIRVYDTMLDVISRLSTRAFVGLPLCRNKEFLQSARMFDRNVVIPAAALNLLPGFLKPLLAPIVTAYDYAHFLILKKYLTPVVNERLKTLKWQGNGQLPSLGGKKPNDYVQWAIDHALAHPDPTERTTTVIVRRFACLCFAAIQSSVITITNTLFDIASSPTCAEYLATMRDEVVAGAGLANRQVTPSWDRAALARMGHVDSTIRESMRLNGFLARGIMKMVVAREGVTLPDGSHIPYGTKVGIQAYSVHRDEELYAEAEKFDAFRFVSEKRQPARKDNSDRGTGHGGAAGSVDVDGSEKGGRGGQAASSGESLESRQPQSLVSTSPTFLAFSYGPNSCPGRFFAANQLKMTLAHVALHYEIEPITRRPSNRWFAGSMAPPMRETLRVRRRKAGVSS